jgi:hypothetical protein
MNMRHFFIVLIAFVGISCEDVIDLDLPEAEPLIVINGRITNQDSVGVSITTTAPYFSQTSTPRVGDAIITLIEDGVEIGQLIPDSLGFYRMDYQGIHGRSYKIRVEIPSGHPLLKEGIWESIPEIIKPVAGIDSIYSEYLENEPPFKDGWYPFFMFTDLANQEDFYRLREWRNDTIMDGPSQITTFQDQFWNGRSFDNQDLPAVRFTGSPKPKGTTYRIEQSSISRRFFEYLNLLVTQTAQVGSTFDPPPAPLLGNIKCISDPNRTSLGFFNASSISVDQVSL